VIAPTIGTTDRSVTETAEWKRSLRRVESHPTGNRDHARILDVPQERDQTNIFMHPNVHFSDKVKGDSSTDTDIEALLQKAFDASPYRQLRSLKIYCHSGRVTLQGCLPTYYLKQVAQTLVREVSDVRDIDNDVKVRASW